MLVTGRPLIVLGIVRSPWTPVHPVMAIVLLLVV